MSILLKQGNAFVDAAVSLGEQVEKAWKQKNYNPDALIAIANEALREAKIHKKFDFDEFVAYFCKTRELPEQMYPNDGFGKPSITLFRRGNLIVDMYFWDHIDTSFHSHGFCGAFTPIYGRTLHSEYRFEAHEGELGQDQVVCGKLKLTSCNIANAGDVFSIAQCGSFVHQVIHFETPALTLLIRNLGGIKQYSYQGSVGYEHAPTPVISLKHSNLLQLLARMKHSDGPVFLKNVIEQCLLNGDEHIAVKFLFGNYFRFLDISEAENFVGSISGFSRWRRGLVDSLEEMQQTRITYKGGGDQLSRFLTSALLVSENWQDLRRLIQQYEAIQEPRNFIREKLRVLIQQGTFPVQFNEVGMSIFLSFFDGMSQEQVFQEILRNFNVSDNVSAHEEIKADIAQLKSQISSLRIFRGLQL